LNPQMCEGEGLGLAIIKKIVLRLNGNVRLESEVGKGSRFFVSLPGA
jgi:two-component system phosphate regulon sensor histidine kinase PhoR